MLASVAGMKVEGHARRRRSLDCAHRARSYAGPVDPRDGTLRSGSSARVRASPSVGRRLPPRSESMPQAMPSVAASSTPATRSAVRVLGAALGRPALAGRLAAAHDGRCGAAPAARGSLGFDDARERLGGGRPRPPLRQPLSEQERGDRHDGRSACSASTRTAQAWPDGAARFPWSACRFLRDRRRWPCALDHRRHRTARGRRSQVSRCRPAQASRFFAGYASSTREVIAGPSRSTPGTLIRGATCVRVRIVVEASAERFLLGRRQRSDPRRGDDRRQRLGRDSQLLRIGRGLAARAAFRLAMSVPQPTSNAGSSSRGAATSSWMPKRARTTIEYTVRLNQARASFQLPPTRVEAMYSPPKSFGDAAQPTRCRWRCREARTGCVARAASAGRGPSSGSGSALVLALALLAFGWIATSACRRAGVTSACARPRQPSGKRGCYDRHGRMLDERPRRISTRRRLAWVPLDRDSPAAASIAVHRRSKTGGFRAHRGVDWLAIAASIRARHRASPRATRCLHAHHAARRLP
jgi:hypothetical protein